MAGRRPILRNLLAGNLFTQPSDKRTLLGQGQSYGERLLEKPMNIYIKNNILSYCPSFR